MRFLALFLGRHRRRRSQIAGLRLHFGGLLGDRESAWCRCHKLTSIGGTDAVEQITAKQVDRVERGQCRVQAEHAHINLNRGGQPSSCIHFWHDYLSLPLGGVQKSRACVCVSVCLCVCLAGYLNCEIKVEIASLIHKESSQET